MKSTDEMQKEWDEAIAKAGVATEAEMREMKPPRLKTVEELSAYVTSLTDRPHDYGTCVYAMSLAAGAAFNFVASKLGCTGFQASCADMQILRYTRGFKFGRILNYENLLYPQYLDEENFPTVQSLLKDPSVISELGEMAEALLKERGEDAHPNVTAHWKSLVGLKMKAEAEAAAKEEGGR